MRRPSTARAAFSALVLFTALCAQVSADRAFAVSPVSGCRVLLGFGEVYGASGTVHRGVDLAAEDGAEVRAPLDGSVVFAGPVPADGGGTVLALTIETKEGTRVTLMPLESASVGGNASVRAGESIGALADGGDGSSAESHVHVSLRRGSVYLDPAPLLTLPPGTTSGNTDPAPAGSTASATDPCVGSGASVGGAHAVSAGTVATEGSVARRASSEPARPVLSQGTGTVQGAGSVPKAAPSVGIAVAAPGAQVSPRASSSARVPTASTDASRFVDRFSNAAVRYARRHVRALALGVAALLAGIAVLTPPGRRAASGNAVCDVRPEGETVAAAAGR